MLVVYRGVSRILCSRWGGGGALMKTRMVIGAF